MLNQQKRSLTQAHSLKRRHLTPALYQLCLMQQTRGRKKLNGKPKKGVHANHLIELVFPITHVVTTLFYAYLRHPYTCIVYIINV
jgi:hypothetical protein